MNIKEKMRFLEYMKIKKNLYDYYGAYNEKIKDEIIDILKTNKTKEEWKKLFEDNKKQGVITPHILFRLLAMTMNKNCPTEIVDDIIENVCDVCPYNSLCTEIRQEILKQSLSRELSEKSLQLLFKKYPKILSEMCANINEPRQNLRQLGNEYKANKIHDKNIEKMCELFLTRKAMMKSITHSPFVITKNNDVAKKILENPRTTETVRTAIAINKNLSEEIRNLAFDHRDGVNEESIIYNATPHMIETIYQSIAGAFTELDVNPQTYNKCNFTKKQKKPYETAANSLVSLITNKKLPIDMQNDLFNRLHGMRLTEKNYVLEQLLRNTTSTYIFEQAEQLTNRHDRDRLYLNPNIPTVQLQNHINNYVNLYKQKGQRAPKYVIENLSALAHKVEFSNDIYEFFLKNEYFLEELSLNPKTPNTILDSIIEKYKDVKPVHSEKRDFNQIWKEQCRQQINTFKIIKKYLDSESAVKLMSALSISKAFDFYDSYQTKSEKNKKFRIQGAYNVFEYKSAIDQMGKEKFNEFLKEIKNESETNQSEYMRLFFKTLLNDFYIIEQVTDKDATLDTRLGHYGEVDNYHYRLLHAEIMYEYDALIRLNPICFFTEMDKYAEIAVKEMKTLEKETKRYNSLYTTYGMNQFKKFIDDFEKGYNCKTIEEYEI